MRTTSDCRGAVEVVWLRSTLFISSCDRLQLSVSFVVVVVAGRKSGGRLMIMKSDRFTLPVV